MAAPSYGGPFPLCEAYTCVCDVVAKFIVVKAINIRIIPFLSVLA